VIQWVCVMQSLSCLLLSIFNILYSLNDLFTCVFLYVTYGERVLDPAVFIRFESMLPCYTDTR